jgi:molybdopterin converting factor small subunit
VKIDVFLHTTLQQHTPSGTISQLTIDLPSKGTLATLLSLLDIHLNIDDILLVVNGRTAELDQQLLDGDQVHLIPAISGGS